MGTPNLVTCVAVSIILTVVACTHATLINKETVTVLFDDDSVTSGNSIGYIGTVETVGTTKSKVIAFKSIPYAQPPIGELRYKPPVPYKEHFLRAATEFPKPCLQWDFFQTRNITGSEDCLHLSIYQPYVPPKTTTTTTTTPKSKQAHDSQDSQDSQEQPQYPVMVFFHGIGFVAGQSDTYSPEYLVHKDVVVVVVQYRLGALGFLSSGDRLQPGNMGLLDQVEALRFIQNKIHYFGGDKQKVTIFGESAGAVSVALHLISPLTNGLFRAAILQSGSPIAPYAIQRTPLTHVKRLAANLGCLDGSTESLLQCIKYSDPREVVASDVHSFNTNEHERKASRSHKKPPNPGPVIQTELVDGWPLYLNEDPLAALEDGRFHQVPIVIGVNRDESASAVINTLLPRLLSSTAKDSTYPERVFLKKVVKSSGYLNNSNILREAIKFEYFKDYNISEIIDLKDEYISLHSDFSIVAPVYKTAVLLSRQNPVYFYTFEYEGELSFSQVLGQIGSEDKNSENLARRATKQVGRPRRRRQVFTKDEATGETLELTPEIVDELEKLDAVSSAGSGSDLEDFNTYQDTHYVIHGEELLYLFQFRNPTTNNMVEIEDAEGKQVREIMTTLWTNVAKYGTPTNQTSSPLIVPWKTFSKEGPYTMKITERTSLMISYRYRKMLFWSHHLPRLAEIETCS